MRILEVQDRTPELIEKLLRVWEDSVRATHIFLSDGEIINIREYVPQALTGIAHLIIAEDDAGEPVAFMGIQEGSLEMLFIENAQRGKGLGRKLLEYGIEKHAVERLAVNEQNPQAKGFYLWASRQRAPKKNNGRKELRKLKDARKGLSPKRFPARHCAGRPSKALPELERGVCKRVRGAKANACTPRAQEGGPKVRTSPLKIKGI